MGTGLKFLFQEEVIMKQGIILGSQIGKWLILVAVVAVLAALLTASVVRAQQDDSMDIEYAENGDGPVATFTAVDPEGATPITWSIATADQVTADDDLDGPDNADAEDFMIDDEDGVLKFDIDAAEDGSSLGSPDFENGLGSGTRNNTYKVVVAASDQETGGMVGYHKVTVTVTNVAEKGKVTWTTASDGTDADVPTLMQFHVGTLLTASATDGDISGNNKAVTSPTWRWYRGSSAISGETGATYRVTTADVGSRIRADATYVVAGNVDQETASLTSDYPVLAVRAGDNELKFDSTMVSREVAESKKGMNVGAPVTATGNHGAVNYTLVDSGDAAAPTPKFKIDQKTGQITTAVDLNYDIEDADNCRDTDFCTVTVRATDASGSATAAAAAPDADPPVFADAIVTIKVTDVNDKPTFSGGPMAITVPENSMVLYGADTAGYSLAADTDVTYTATDPESRSITYHLMGPDRNKFQLGASPRVLSFKEEHDYEMPTDANKDNVYEVTVRASDGMLNEDQMVKVTVTNVDDAPAVSGPASVNFAENGDGPVATFTAVDPEGATPITWSIATADQVTADDDLDGPDNADAEDFMIDDEDGVLKFDIDAAEDGSSLGSPDFENGLGSGTRNNTYKVVVAASDQETGGMVGYHKVTVTVTNVAEKGKVTWTTASDGTDADVPTLMQFHVGTLLTASATDGDISGNNKAVTSPTWRWYRGSSAISGETGATYRVTTADVGSRIRADATYVVAGNVDQETASLTSDYPVLAVRAGDNELKFDSTMVSREVAESKKGMNVGAPVTATGNHGAVNYTLVDSGDAAAPTPKFKIDQKTGQITTAVDLNYDIEDADNCRDTDFCTVTVRATDASGSATAAAAAPDADPPVFADAIVTIKVTDVNDKPTFSGGPMAITVPENSMVLYGADTAGYSLAADTDVTYTATDPERLNVNLTLMGPDVAMFSLSSAGVLSFKEEHDYEMPADSNRDNVYEVTVRASDGMLNEDQMVKVTVENVDEAPEILSPGVRVSGSSSLYYAENGMDAVGTYTASGSQAESARWTLEGDDAGDFRLSSSSGMSTMLMFRSSPDYEMRMDADTDNTYMVTVKASYGSGAEMGMDTRDVTVMVTNEEETGAVTLSSMTPVVGTAVTASVTDLDVVVTDSVMWQWSKSMTMDGTFTDIADATLMAYTPMEADKNYYLRAKATYTDGYDSGNEKMATTTSAVVSNRAPMFAGATTTREVAENTAAGMNIGAPVAAMDPDGDTLDYTLSGTDAESFDIGDSTGQLMTKAALDYETKMSYMVTVTAADPDGETDAIEVTINVTNVDETPVEKYDRDNDGSISRTELFNAVDDYFDGELTTSELFDVIDAYFASNG